MMEGKTVVCLATQRTQATVVLAARECTRLSEKVNRQKLSAEVCLRCGTLIPFGSVDQVMGML
jgi:hypothetical protein